MTGVFTLAVEAETEQELRSLPDRVDLMVADLVDDIVEFAGKRIEQHAPGSISRLVDVRGASAVDPGVVEGVAGVRPADLGRGGKTMVQTGSDPDDYPFFVEVGTGVYGEFGTPITVAPPGFMVIDFPDGQVRTRKVKGQQPQRYVERSFEETAEYVPIRLAASRLPSGGT